MTKQRPASLNGSLLVKKGEAKPSVAASTDPVAKKVSRFPDPETIAELPLVSTPPIGDLYGNADKDETEKPLATAAPAARSEPTVSAPVDKEPQAPISTPTVQQEDRVAPAENSDPAPEPRLVFLLPRPSWRFVVSAVLAGVMGVSAWYLMSTSENEGTQRLASVAPADEAASAATGENPGAISPPPSGINKPHADAKTPENAANPAPEATKPAVTAAKPPVPSAKPKPSTPAATVASSSPQYAIQLLATKSAEAGREAWAQISSKHSNQLGGLSLDLQTVTLQGRGKFVRVRAGPIDGKQVAINRCKALSSAGQDCLVVKF